MDCSLVYKATLHDPSMHKQTVYITSDFDQIQPNSRVTMASFIRVAQENYATMMITPGKSEEGAAKHNLYIKTLHPTECEQLKTTVIP